MIKSSKSIYWMLALGLIGKNEVILWADRQINSGGCDEKIYELSTCSQMDANEIMDALKAVKVDNECTQNELLDFLKSYYLNCAELELSKNWLLLDYCRIDDFTETVSIGLQWLEDDISLIADGIKPISTDLRHYIIIEIEKLMVDQQSGKVDVK